MELLNVEQVALPVCICEILTLWPGLLKCEGFLSEDVAVEWNTYHEASLGLGDHRYHHRVSLHSTALYAEPNRDD